VAVLSLRDGKLNNLQDHEKRKWFLVRVFSCDFVDRIYAYEERIHEITRSHTKGKVSFFKSFPLRSFAKTLASFAFRSNVRLHTICLQAENLALISENLLLLSAQ
jgi:hypothetical protein